MEIGNLNTAVWQSMLRQDTPNRLNALRRGLSFSQGCTDKGAALSR
jgi:hypothetical protein